MTNLQKIATDKIAFLEFVTLLLLAARPALDLWRDFTLGFIGSHAVSLNAVLSLLMLGFSTTLIIFKRAKLPQIVKTLPLFAAWASLTIIYSFDRANTFLELIRLYNLVALFFAAYLLQKNDKTFSNRLYMAAVFAAILPLLFAIYQQFTHTGLLIDGVPNRIYGTFAHPNLLAIFAIFLVALIFKARENGYKLARAGYATLLILIGVILGTYTRSVWIVLLLGLAAYLWRDQRRLMYYVAGGVLAFYLIFYPLNYFLKTYHHHNLQSIPLIARLTSRPANADSIAWRLGVAKDSLGLFIKHPILGWGYGAFPSVWVTYRDAARAGDPSSEAHNDYIRILVETGIVGLGLYLKFFIDLIRIALATARKSKWTKIIFLMSVLGYCLLNFSENLLHHTAVAWWIFAAWGAWVTESPSLTTKK